MTRYIIVAAVVAFITAGNFSCNIFSPTESSRDPGRYGPLSLVQEGKIKMRDEDWVGAIALFDQALAENDSLSEAYFYKGKCILRIADIDLNDVWDEINPAKKDSNAVPFLFRDNDGRPLTDTVVLPAHLNAYWQAVDPSASPSGRTTLLDSVFLHRKRVYDAVCKAIVCLEAIHRNPPAMDGVIVRKQYEPDYLVEISVKAVLSIVDLNANDSLDVVGDEKEVFKILIEDIPSLDPDSMTFDSLKNISRNPNEINEKITLMLDKIEKADTSFVNFKQQLKEGAEETDKLDPNMVDPLGNMIRDFKDILPFFFYKDKLDNDSDYYDTHQNGIREPMIWIDWDYDDSIDIVYTPPGSGQKHVHIGDPQHMLDSAQFYEIIDTDPDSDYKRYRYKGPHGYEFIAGDWGVDEEILDGHDNDLDGITDEDTRCVADTLDDEGVSLDTIPLVWEDLNADFRIDPGEIDSGSVYCDEEWYDGLDNDGDGLVDEDVGERIPPESSRAALIDSLRARGLRN